MAQRAGTGGSRRAAAPRVKISYDNEAERRGRAELPFVLGVLGDFDGKPEQPTKLRERKFVEVDRASFDTVLERMRPRLAFRVESHLGSPGSKLGVELTFRSLDDFTPEAVVNGVPSLREIAAVRAELADLLRLVRERKERAR